MVLVIFKVILNYLSRKRYEPTYFLNEAYMPPIKFWPLFDLQKEGYNPDFSTGTPTPPEPKHFVKPIPLNDTVLTPTKIDPVYLKFYILAFKMLVTTINKDFVSCFPKKVFNKNGNVLLDSLREESSSDFIVTRWND